MEARPVLHRQLRPALDQFQAFDAESQLSPRINAVWQATSTTTLHAGYSRYFSPPPIELVANTDIVLFANTTAAPPNTTDDITKAERANYYDAGIEQVIAKGFTVGLDSFYKTSKNLIDEGQFGAPIILTPFNYRQGRQYGLELTTDIVEGNSWPTPTRLMSGRKARTSCRASSNFDPGDLAYIADNFIPLDHQQIVSVSAGASYRFLGTRLSTDLIYGTGLRKDGTTPNGDHVPDYTQVNFGASHDFKLGALGGFTVRGDIINAFDEKYEIGTARASVSAHRSSGHGADFRRAVKGALARCSRLQKRPSTSQCSAGRPEGSGSFTLPLLFCGDWRLT